MIRIPSPDRVGLAYPIFDCVYFAFVEIECLMYYWGFKDIEVSVTEALADTSFKRLIRPERKFDSLGP